MRTHRRIALCLLILAATGLACRFPLLRQSGGGDIPVIVEGEDGRKVDEFLTRLSGFGYRGAMLVAVREKIILRRGYGLARQAERKDENVPNTPGTLFDVGSFAKTFTAAAVLQLEEAGRLRVTDPISGYLTDVPPDKAGVTIHQLLTHTSGVVDDFGLYEDIGREEAIQRVLRLPLSFPPGSDYAYSNGGYVVLAAIVETAAGVPYREYVRRHIFGPAGMKDTGFWGKSAPPVARSRTALGYDEIGQVGDLIAWSDSTWFDLGGGMVLSTLDDLRAWVSELDAGTVLSRKSVDRMFTPFAKETPRGQYGYGWYIDPKSPHGTLIHHGGDSIGFGADVRWYRDEGVLVISLCNIRHDWFPTHIRADRVVSKILFDEPHPMPPEFLTAGSAGTGVSSVAVGELERKLAGSYRLPTGGTLVIEPFRGQLHIGALGQDAVNTLAGADSTQEAAWAARSDQLRLAFEGLVRGDSAAFDVMSGNGGRGFREAVQQEMRALGGGPVERIEVLGTSAGGFPPGAMSTLLRLRYAAGKVLAYRVSTTVDGTIMATTDRCAALCALIPIQAQADGRFAGWDLITESGFGITVREEHGRASEISIERGDRHWSATRME